jgi:CRISPR/Cas system-associated endonuclease Cas1
MGRPRCDPFDANTVALAIEAGETTPLRAYEAYASVAARPYARSSWEVLLKNNKGIQTDNKPPLTIKHTKAQASYWLDPVKPSNILTTTFDNASLKVKGAALIVTDGDRKIIYEQRGLKPQAIVMTGWGGYITIEAIRFCTDYNIAVIILDWSRDLMSVVSPSVKQSGPMICAQATCDPLPIAKALIQAKIEAHAKLGAISHTAATNAIANLHRATSIAAILIIEAQAARLAWVEHTIAMQWREAGSVPKGWKLPYGLRRRMTGKTPKAATDPINSMLNLALATTIGRITVALMARGLSPAIGTIHKSPRWPLSYDTIEPLRPHIEASVFKFIDRHRFAASDFVIENKTHAVKFFEPMMNVFVEAVSLPQLMINQTVDCLVQTIHQTRK